MAEAIVVKTIKPARFNDAAFKRKLFAAMDAEAQDMKQDFEKTTDTWEHDVKFTIASTVKPNGPEVLVGTDDEIYGYVNDGTKRHPIFAGIFTGKSTKKALSFQWGGKGSYRPKTTPRVIGSKSGGSSGPQVVRPFVQHPGTKGRHFDEVIEKKHKPKFKRRMEKAMSDAAKASGHGT